VTPTEYAAHRRVTRQAVHKAIREGRITLVRGRLDQRLADREWIENSVGDEPQGTENGAGPEVATLRQGRALWQLYRARLARLEFEEKSGRLVDAEEARVVAFEYGRRVHDQLSAIPARVAPALVSARTRAECERIVAAEIRRVLEELARPEAPAQEKRA
jgi:phage terminase Nu1 subunit (DNA packaging protein)